MMTVVRTVESTGTTRRIVWRRVDTAAPAGAAIVSTPEHTRPSLVLTSVLDGTGRTWSAVSDLLNSDGQDPAVVAETELDGSTTLRFGDNEHGRCPEPGEAFAAVYRVGNGRAGNVGPESIHHAVTADARILAVRNPLAAAGGVDPETIAEARRRAPEAFRAQRRAVTPADYEGLLGRQPGVQRAAARLRWTGSWHTHFLAVDRFDGEALTPAFEAALRDAVEPFRLAGHDVEFDAPVYLSLEVEVEVCVANDYFRSDVKARLLDVLSNRALPDGRQGLFHPDRLTFGQTIYISPVLAAVRTVEGVASARIVQFSRQGTTDARALETGRIDLGRTEIARLDNDPNWPENGVLRLTMLGGK
jgi:predicted phage baseplate assembly protein